jgi:hypothetical protein
MTIAYRLSLLALLPVLLFGGGALIGDVATRVAKLVAPEPLTLLQAVATGDDDAIFRMVVAGEDPGLPTVLERRLIYWRPGDTTSPLLVAIADGDLNRVAYLARNTEHLAEPPNDLALCVAARLGHANLARFLMKIGAPAVPKIGCGELSRPEDFARKYRSGSLARELRQYRLESR